MQPGSGPPVPGPAKRRTVPGMDVEYPGFGRIVVTGTEYDHDVVVEAGRVRARDKRPSHSLKVRYGHTPLSAAEEIPATASRLRGWEYRRPR